MIGVHANTIRFYESMGLIPKPEREPNGYRVYTERHWLQLQLLRIAFKAEILNANLRKEVIDIVKTSATGDFAAAIQKTLSYRIHIEAEIGRAREAIRLTEQMINGAAVTEDTMSVIGRREAAARIGVSFDVLRDWERNRLLEIPRFGNRRQYGGSEMNRLKIIAVLRNGGYSQSAIRRMLGKLEHGDNDLLLASDTPAPDDDIISVTDRYITSLSGALGDTDKMLRQLEMLERHDK
jgi:DNA-binding transcriptional MerR regulator